MLKKLLIKEDVSRHYFLFIYLRILFVLMDSNTSFLLYTLWHRRVGGKMSKGLQGSHAS